MLMSDGRRYKGSFVDGFKQGEGIDYYPDGKKAYEGTFHMHKAHGKGICYSSDGKRYKGEWVNGVRNGHGAIYSPRDEILCEGNLKMEA